MTMTATKQTTIVIDTCNIFKCGLLQPKVLQSPTAEVIEGLKCILDGQAGWKTIKLDMSDLPEVHYLSEEEIPSTQNHDRSKLKLTIKLFLFPEDYPDSEEYRKHLIEESVRVIFKVLEVHHNIDNLILSIQTDDVDQVVPLLKSFWLHCEKFVASEMIRLLGTSDLNYTQLSELYNWAPTVKPSSTQINLDTCCDIPAELSAFAKEHSIQLLTHNDPAAEFFPVEPLKSVLGCKGAIFEKIGITNVNKNLKRKWVARYTFLVPGQGVVLSKGYLVSLLTE